MEGNLRFKTNWASLIVGSEFTVSALFYFVFEGNFPRTSPWGAYIWRGYLTEGFLRYRLGGLVFGGACTRRGLFSEFYVNYYTLHHNKDVSPTLFFFFFFKTIIINRGGGGPLE